MVLVQDCNPVNHSKSHKQTQKLERGEEEVPLKKDESSQSSFAVEAVQKTKGRNGPHS